MYASSKVDPFFAEFPHFYSFIFIISFTTTISIEGDFFFKLIGQ